MKITPSILKFLYEFDCNLYMQSNIVYEDLDRYLKNMKTTYTNNYRRKNKNCNNLV